VLYEVVCEERLMSIEEIVAQLVQKVERRFYGKHRGFVVDNADPEQLGRLKVKVPSVLGSDIVTGWALPCTPYGGDVDQGFLFIPEAGAGVWVEFEEGDLEFPIWVGTFWSKPAGDSELPKPNKADGTEESSVQDPPTRKMIKTKAGHTIQFEDDGGSEMVMIIENTHQHVIAMDDNGIKIRDGKNNNTITMNANGIEITDPNNKIQLAGSGVVVESNQIKLGGANTFQPVVLGIKLLTWLAMHVHPTSTGPSGPPTPPPTPSDFCSQQNQTL
jgi:uncharacterized protein involved in type VI secretion and phage assembly